MCVSDLVPVIAPLSLSQRYFSTGCIQQLQAFVSLTVQVYVRGEQGWCSDDSTGLPPVWPGFESRCQRHTWVELLVLVLAPRGDRFFSGASGSTLSLKANTSKLRFDLEHTNTFKRVLQVAKYFLGKRKTFSKRNQHVHFISILDDSIGHLTKAALSYSYQDPSDFCFLGQVKTVLIWKLWK